MLPSKAIGAPVQESAVVQFDVVVAGLGEDCPI